MDDLMEALERGVDADGAVTKCGECGEEFFNSFREARAQPWEATAVTKIEFRDHEIGTGHDDLLIEIVNPPQESEDIDFTVVETDG